MELAASFALPCGLDLCPCGLKAQQGPVHLSHADDLSSLRFWLPNKWFPAVEHKQSAVWNIWVFGMFVCNSAACLSKSVRSGQMIIMVTLSSSSESYSFMDYLPISNILHPIQLILQHNWGRAAKIGTISFLSHICTVIAFPTEPTDFVNDFGFLLSQESPVFLCILLMKHDVWTIFTVLTSLYLVPLRDPSGVWHWLPFLNATSFFYLSFFTNFLSRPIYTP